MSLTVEEVRRIALLARLRLSLDEEEMFVSQLSRVVDYIDQLRQFDVASEPREKAARGEAEDEVGPSLEQERFLDNAPATLDSFLVVPRVKGSDDE